MTDDHLEAALANLARYSGPKPPELGFNVVISPAALALIGHIVAQWSALADTMWSALADTIKFRVSFMRGHPGVPPELRKEHVRSETKYKIAYIEKLGEAIYPKERKGAEKEFSKLISRINRLKGHKDALVHGTFALVDNKDPNVVVVHYKKKKIRFTIARLTEIGREIGIANGSLIEFDQWVGHETHVTLTRKLFELAGSECTGRVIT